MSPLPQTASERAERLEVWSDLEAAGGTRLTAIPETAFIDTKFDARLEEGRTFEVTVRRDHASFDAVQEARVLRVQYPGAKAFEFRIRDVGEGVEQDGSKLAALFAEGPLVDLETRDGLLERVEANGLVRHRFEVLSLPPADHVDLILGGPSAYSSGAPSYFSVGLVEPTEPVDMVYDWDTALSALRELIKVIEGNAELQVRRDGGSGYLVDIMHQAPITPAYDDQAFSSGFALGDTPPVLVAVGRNLHQFRRERSTEEQGTRVLPKGGSEGQSRADMTQAAWTVYEVSGSQIAFEDRPLNEDGQLVGAYVEKEDGSLTEVTASTAPDKVTVSDASGVAPGDLMRFRRNAAGDHLPYLSSPSAVSTYGVIQKQIELSGVPPVDNVVRNPFLDAWTAGLPDHWDSIRAPSVSRNTDSRFTDKGSSSARVVADKGDGMATAAVDVLPTDEKPYYSGRVALWVVSGSVRLELIDVTNGTDWPPRESEKAAITDEQGVWVEGLGVAPGEDFNAADTQQLQLRITAAEDGTEFYLDAGQITNTAAGKRTFYQGRASNRLWKAALKELAIHAEPLDTVELEASDLTALDDVRWPDESLYVGQAARIRVPALDVDIERRIVRIARDPFRPADMAVEIETEREKLSRLLARSERRRREQKEDRPEPKNLPADPSGFVGFYDDRIVLAWDDVKGASRYLIRKQGSGATKKERWADGDPFANVDGTSYVDADPDQGSLDLTMRAVSDSGRKSRGVVELSISATGKLVREVIEETYSQVSIDLTPVWGGPGRTFSVEFWGRDGNDSFAADPDQKSLGVSRGSTVSFSYGLPEKHGAAVRYRVVDEATGVEIADRTVKADSFKIADVVIEELGRIEAAAAGENNLIARIKGDGDTDDVAVESRLDLEPPDPSLSSPRLGGRSGIYDSGLTGESSLVFWVKALGIQPDGTLAPSQTMAEAKTRITRSNVQKSLRFGHGGVTAQTPGSISRTNTYLHPTNVDQEATGIAQLPLPPGVVIKNLRARGYIADTSDYWVADILSYDGGSLNAVVQSASDEDVLGWATNDSATADFTVGADDNLVFRMTVYANSGSADAEEARIAWAEVEYTAPGVDRTY